MKVIVGKALRTRTPLLTRALRFIEFSPYWNVPPSLAVGETVLRDEAAWPEDRIREAMGAGVSSTLRLKQTLHVLIACSTVLARAESVYFYPDLYGHDAVLDRALRQRSGGLPPLLGRTDHGP